MSFTSTSLGLRALRAGSRAAIGRGLALMRERDAGTDGLASQTRPGDFDDAGLGVALRQLVQRLTDAAAVDAECRCDIDGDPLSPEHHVTVYRVAQEALQNVLTHAYAAHVYVLCVTRKDSLVLIVQDDGIGFTPSDPSAARGSGLMGMNERAVLAGGTLHVESSLGHGTTVFLRIPLQRSASWRRTLARAIRATTSSARRTGWLSSVVQSRTMSEGRHRRVATAHASQAHVTSMRAPREDDRSSQSGLPLVGRSGSRT